MICLVGPVNINIFRRRVFDVVKDKDVILIVLDLRVDFKSGDRCPNKEGAEEDTEILREEKIL